MELTIILLLICLFCSACFSGFENGIVSVRQARLEHAIAQGQRSARLIKWFLDHPGRMMATVLLGNNLVNCFASIYFDELISALPFLHGHHASLWLATGISIVMVFILLIVGEITPKVWFRQNPLPRTQLLIYPMYLLSWLFSPFVLALTAFTSLLRRCFPTSERTEEIARAREEFRIMLRESEENALIDREARGLLENALDYHGRRVRDVMTGRGDVLTVPADYTLAQAIAYSEQTGCSRFPVTRGGKAPSATSWIGIFSVYDAVYRVDRARWGDEPVLRHIRPLVTIHEDAAVHQVLPRMTLNHTPLLAVLDRQGLPAGLVTADDVVQPLFGEFES